MASAEIRCGASTGSQTFRSARRSGAWPRRLQVVVVAAIVHVLWLYASSQPPLANETTALPPHVADVREALLSAARTGNIDDLQPVFDMSSALPDLGIGGGNDPVAALKAASADGNGREVLAALIEVLSLPHAALPLGKDLENNLIYVWPYLAERPLDRLKPAEDIDLLRLVTPAKAQEMRDKKRWTWWRLEIGADGNWIAFKKSD